MKFILSYLMIFCCAFGFAQTKVTGNVVDSNGVPVLGANVIIVGTAEGTTTDFDGNFVLTTDKAPPFQLRFTSLGYSEVIQDVTSNNQSLAVVMNETSTILDEIVISASRTPERIFESPVSIERFGLKDIRNTSSESFYNGLQNLKGIDITTNSLTFQSINTRGFSTFANNRFQQLVDGIDNAAPGLNFVIGNIVGISELEVSSVEILPGASSALYGAGAFNGILFLTGKNPFDYEGVSGYFKSGVTTQQAAGTNGYYDLGIRFAHAFSDKVAVKANFSFLSGEDWHAVSDVDVNNPGADRTDPAFDGLNIYGDEVATVINFDAAAGLPTGTVGSANISRTGYREQDLVDYNASSVKTDFSLHYRPLANDLELIYQGRLGTGNTIFQGANRNALRDFRLFQHKVEVRNDDFFVRAYVSSENSGNSYDTRFTGININRRFKSDVQWFTDYAGTYIPAFLNGVQAQGLSREDAETQAHALARTSADDGRFIPGTAAFQEAFNEVTTDGDLTTGSRFIDNSSLRHINGNYNIAHLIDDWADIQIGGSFRGYRLDSQGTIFTDFDGPITYTEYGVYVQGQKNFLDDRLKITASGRLDQNEFFDAFFSPRASIGYTIGAKRNHNVRASFQTGFRNPTTQDLFIGLDVGNAILVGGAPTNLDRDVRTFDISPVGQGIIGQSTLEVNSGDAYANAFSVSSVLAGAPEAIETPIVQPEQVTAFEVGYRGQFGKFTIDASGYINQFTNFIANVNVILPFYGTPGDGALSLLALQNGDSQVFSLTSNSPAEINSFGGVVGVDVRLGKFDLGLNYTYADFDFDRGLFPDVQTSFNTANHKVKGAFGSTNLFKNFGFNINWRWSDSYFWEADFGDGDIPSFNVVDAQVNYTIPKIKSIFKAGASNLLNEEYTTAFGTGNIGAIYFLSWTINP